MKNKVLILALCVISTHCVSQAVSFGGWVPRPGSQRGSVTIIDTQNRIPESVFRNVVDIFEAGTMIKFCYAKANPDDPQSLATSSSSQVNLVIVDDDKTPSMLIAPDDFWGVVNVRKLDKNLKSESARRKFYHSRCGKEAIRALSLLCGCGASQFSGNVSNASRIEDLDLCQGKALPVDVQQKILHHLGQIGITPLETLAYEDACMSGIAPTPTNDVQTAIWNRVHAPPSEPIKITFDPKTDTE